MYVGNVLNVVLLVENGIRIGLLVNLYASERKRSLSFVAERKTGLQFGYGFLKNLVTAPQTIIDMHSKDTMNFATAGTFILTIRL